MPPPPGAAEESAAASASEMPAAIPNDGSAEVPKSKTKKIEKVEVIALRVAFFKQVRISEGDRLMVPEDKLGSWMKCVDPVKQREHEKNMAEKKKAMRSKLIAGF